MNFFKKSKRVVVALFAMTLGSCGGGGGGSDSPPPPPANQKPTVSISNVGSGQVVSGTFAVEINASDSDGSISTITCLEKNTGTELTVTGAGPYSCCAPSSRP